MDKSIQIEDPLLSFFFDLLPSDEEKEIIYMIFKNQTFEYIIESTIKYSPPEQDDTLSISNKAQ
jgi:hypothetical protein